MGNDKAHAGAGTGGSSEEMVRDLDGYLHGKSPGDRAYSELLDLLQAEAKNEATVRMLGALDDAVGERLDDRYQWGRAVAKRSTTARLASLEARLDRMAEEVVTRRVVVVDDAGRQRVRLDQGVVLIDEGGVERIHLSTGPEHGQIEMATTDPRTFAAWSAGEELHSAEIHFDLYTRDEAVVSIGVDAGELAPGKPGIDPACRLRGLDGPYPWVHVAGHRVEEQMAIVREAVGAAKRGFEVAERCVALVEGLAEEVVTRRLRIVDEHNRTWVEASTGRNGGEVRCTVPDDSGTSSATVRCPRPER
jgi:hypothetical protein